MTTYRFEYILRDGRRGIETRTYRLKLNAAHRYFWRWLNRTRDVREMLTTIADLQVTTL